MAGLNTNTGQRNAQYVGQRGSQYTPSSKVFVPNRSGNENSSQYKNEKPVGFAVNNPYFDPNRPRDDWQSLDNNRKLEQDDIAFYASVLNNIGDANLERQKDLQTQRLRSNEYVQTLQGNSVVEQVRGQANIAAIQANAQKYLGVLNSNDRRQVELPLGMAKVQADENAARINASANQFKAVTDLQASFEQGLAQKEIAKTQAETQKQQNLLGFYGGLFNSGNKANINYWGG